MKKDHGSIFTSSWIKLTFNVNNSSYKNIYSSSVWGSSTALTIPFQFIDWVLPALFAIRKDTLLLNVYVTYKYNER